MGPGEDPRPDASWHALIEELRMHTRVRSIIFDLARSKFRDEYASALGPGPLEVSGAEASGVVPITQIN